MAASPAHWHKNSIAILVVLLLVTLANGMRLVNITVFDQGSTDMVLQYNDQVTILFVFDEAFDDSDVGTCNPFLVLNAVSSASTSSVRWIPRANITTLYGFQHSSPQNQYQLQPPSSNALAFRYIVSKGDWTPALDIGNSITPKAGALSFVCSTSPDDNRPPPIALEFDLSPLSSLSVQPVYSVNSRVPFPVQVKTRQKSGTFGLGDQIDIIIEYDTPILATASPAPFVPSFDSGAWLQLQSSEEGIMGYYPEQIPQNPYSNPTSIKLSNGGLAYFVGFDGNDKYSLVFRYAVGDAGGSAESIDALEIDWKSAPGGIRMGSTVLSSSQSGIRLDDPGIYNVTSFALSLTSVAQLKIVATGDVKFPPASYDADAIPFRSGASRRPSKRASITAPDPVEVQVMIDFQALWSVIEKTQSFSADVVRLLRWYDARFDNPSMPFRQDLSFSELSKIWHPRLTFHNTREFLKPMDFVCAVFNNGTVMVQERFIHSFYSRLNVRKFPFDTQSFEVIVRSVSYDRNVVKLVPYATLPQDFVPPSDGVWDFIDIKQAVKVSQFGLYQNYDLLHTVVRSHRISTYNVIMVFFPLVAICLAQLLTYFFPIKSDSRMSVCLTGMIATITFNFVVGTSAPPVNYLTRMTLFSVLTLIFCAVNLVIQTFIRSVMFAVELIKKERDKEKKEKGKAAAEGGEMQDLSAKRKELASPLLLSDSSSPTIAVSEHQKSDKVEELTDCVLFFGLITITNQNRVRWIRRLTLLNDIVRVVFFVVIFVTITILIAY